jgi:hypothetical protein
MSTYTPDRWKIIKLTSAEGSHYRIFATWSGSYLGGASWKLSSGCTGCYKDSRWFCLPQSSGSLYKIHEEAEGITGAWHGILAQLQKLAPEQKITIEVLDAPDISTLDFK